MMTFHFATLLSQSTHTARDKDTPSLTRSNLIQLLYLVSLNWEEVKNGDLLTALRNMQSKMKDQPVQLLLRSKKYTMKLILHPSNPLSINLEILVAAVESMDSSARDSQPVAPP